MIEYSLTDKYNEIEDDILFPPTATYKEWLSETPDHIKLLSLICGAIDGDISENFQLDDTFFEALENEYEFCGYTLERDIVIECCEELYDLGYLE